MKQINWLKEWTLTLDQMCDHLKDYAWFTKNLSLFLLGKLAISDAMNLFDNFEKWVTYVLCTNDLKQQIKDYFNKSIENFSTFSDLRWLYNNIYAFYFFTDFDDWLNLRDKCLEKLFDLAVLSEHYSYLNNCVKYIIHHELALVEFFKEAGFIPEKTLEIEAKFKNKLQIKISGLWVVIDQECESEFVDYKEHVLWLDLNHCLILHKRYLKDTIQCYWNELYSQVSALKDSVASDLTSTLVK